MRTSQRTLQPGERIRVMVVDDSVVIRRLVTHALGQDPTLEVVGSAANGVIGLERIPQLDPDVITLDIEMPEMNGLDMLRHIRRDYPYLRTIMFSTLTVRAAEVTLEALTLGADDYVAKVSNEGSLTESMSRLTAEMIPKIKQFFRVPVDLPVHRDIANGNSGVITTSQFRDVARPDRTRPEPGSFRREPPPPRGTSGRPKVLVIGVSTGGPAALGVILPSFPADFPIPVLIVQHMPPLFTRLLAERLDASCALKVEEAQQGSVVEAGKVLIAPGDFHMRVVSDHGRLSTALDQSAQENFCRPAVDVLFRAASEVYGGAVLAVVLTGMGQDGLRGVEVLKSQGARIFAQDEASSVVWGMPGAVANAGYADSILPLEQIVPEILRVAGRT